MSGNERFCCDGCRGLFKEAALRRRQSMPGQFCGPCAAHEKCAACGDLQPAAEVTFKQDVQNYICLQCANDYTEVAEYIKPAYYIKSRSPVVRPLDTNNLETAA